MTQRVHNNMYNVSTCSTASTCQDNTLLGSTRVSSVVFRDIRSTRECMLFQHVLSCSVGYARQLWPQRKKCHPGRRRYATSSIYPCTLLVEMFGLRKLRNGLRKLSQFSFPMQIYCAEMKLAKIKLAFYIMLSSKRSDWPIGWSELTTMRTQNYVKSFFIQQLVKLF